MKPEGKIRWTKLAHWYEIDAYFRCGPWQFARDHGGAHRVEYGWFIEYRCLDSTCERKLKDENPPPTPPLE